MAVNLIPFLFKDYQNTRANFAVGASPRSVFFHPNGVNSYLFSAEYDSVTVSFYRFDPETTTGAVAASSRRAVFATNNRPLSVFFHPNGVNSYLFSVDHNSSLISFYRFDPETITGNIATNSRRATFATGSLPISAFFHPNGVNSYLFSADFNSTANTISFHRFDPETTTGAVAASSRRATFATGARPFSLHFHPNGVNSYLFSADFGSNIISFYRFDPETVTGTITTSSRRATFATGTQPISVVFHPNGVNSYLFSSDFGSNIISFYRFDPETVTGNITTSSRRATFATGTGPHSVFFYPNGANSYLFSADLNSNLISFYRFDPETVTGNITTSDRRATFATGNAPISVFFHPNGVNSYLFSADSNSNTISFYRRDFEVREYTLTAIQEIVSSNSPDITRGDPAVPGSLFLSNTITDFALFRLLRSFAIDTAIAVDLVEDTDFSGTLNEDFVFVGTSHITGTSYSLTIGANKTVTLGSGTPYNEIFSLPSTATLALTANATLGEDFVLSGGTTVDGPYTLTIPYADPGLVLGTGTTIAAPQPTLELTNLVAGSRVYVQNTTDEVELFNEIEATTTWSETVPSGKALLIRVRNSSGTPNYKTFQTTTGALTSNTSIVINQELDE